MTQAAQHPPNDQEGNMIEYRTMDDEKTQWGDGPWNDEPDKVQWIDDETDLDCLIVRNRLGALCGYVGVPPEHPLHGQDYDIVNVDVHGGLTYANGCQEGDEATSVCHIPEDGRPDNVWWFGFDCAHAWDLTPGMPFSSSDEIYRDIGYVKDEVASLAKRLAERST